MVDNSDFMLPTDDLCSYIEVPETGFSVSSPHHPVAIGHRLVLGHPDAIMGHSTPTGEAHKTEGHPPNRAPPGGNSLGLKARVSFPTDLSFN
jgi:hypothetical protein